MAVHTVKSPEQQMCFSEAEALVSELEHQCVLGDQSDVEYKKKANSFLNACLSESTSGPIDYKFQKIVLGCKLEDQKSIRQRLECLADGRCHIDFVERLFKNSNSDQTQKKHETNKNENSDQSG